ncbi:MAG: DUF6504 family protein [Dehalococcoidia bacterium]
MAQRFFGQEIQVEVAGDVRQPVSFRLERKDHAITEILNVWPDYGFGNSPPQRKKWWQRHHRNYYRVCTAQGDVFEIYYDRGVSPKNPKYKKWYVSRQLGPPGEKPQSAASDLGDAV